MPTLDYITAPYDALWALLEGDAGWAAKVKPGNRIRWTGASAGLAARKPGRAEGDLPEAELRLGAFSHSLATAAPTFGQGAWVEEVAQEYVLTVTHADLRLAPADALKVATLDALRAGVPSLGLAYVSGIGPVTAQDQSAPDPPPSKGNPGGPVRLVTTFIIPVRMRFAARAGG